MISYDVVFFTWVSARFFPTGHSLLRTKINRLAISARIRMIQNRNQKRLRLLASPPGEFMTRRKVYDSFFMCAEAVFAISFLVPIWSKAISRRASPPIFMTDSTIPFPKAVC